MPNFMHDLGTSVTVTLYPTTYSTVHAAATFEKQPTMCDAAHADTDT